MNEVEPLNVLIVDDSPIVRTTLAQMLEPLLAPVNITFAPDGTTALSRTGKKKFDLITLDLAMPVMDGFSFLRLFRQRSDTPVLVVSALDQTQSIEMALELGADAVLSKPGEGVLEAVGEELSLKLRSILPLQCRIGRRLTAAISPQGAAEQRGAQPPAGGAGLAASQFGDVVVIGSSSGGPPTLQYLLSGLPENMHGAVIVAQHMPEGFTKGMAERFDRLLHVKVREAKNGDPLRAGEVALCPGGHHLRLVEQAGGGVVFDVKPAGEIMPAPSVDQLFESAAEVFGKRLMGIVLTGMGDDGARGVRSVHEAGGVVIAESSETAAIFGMPRQAAATGCVDETLALPAIAVRLIKKVSDEMIGVGATG